jgi:hypothetical protein
MAKQPNRPQPGISYAADPTPEFAEQRSWDAAVSLGRALGVPADEARSMLADGTAAAEIRSMRGLSVREARRVMERKFRAP